MSPFLPPKPYVYLNFSSFDTLEAAKELSVAFRGKGLTWHPPNEAHTLCHVCGRSGCSLLSNNNNNNINTSRPNVSNCKNQSNNNNTNSRNNANSSGSTQSSHTLRPNDTTSTSPNNHPNYCSHLNTLEETVSWMNDTITAHEYKLSELKSMMNYDNPGDSDLYPPCDDPEIQENSYNRGWDDIPAQDTNSGFNLPPHTFSSLMDTSPDASFSALNPNSVLSRRHVLLLNSRHNIITPDATTSRLQLEISNVTNVQKNLSTQLGSIMEKLDSFSPSKSSPFND
ncbi:hypothetical protein RhiirA5_419106 [Rhizophagus irregularis]|uniref:RRM domain-containing protein n=1 Tax=Rhizophagus irregularis TaxID=588596 RepID=A0A2N0PIZ0_9GLOM|nr:hypothetical protein RhiirA5_419106 [Rhizophagus irregularis]